jgi:6,7-dimethyl-8-ribityllumazine synthase
MKFQIRNSKPDVCGRQFPVSNFAHWNFNRISSFEFQIHYNLPMQTGVPAFTPADVPRSTKIAVIAARFNADIVDELLARCLRRLGELGVTEERIHACRVPGAFELPFAAKLLAQRTNVEAIICLGCVIRGDTPHFDYVAGEAARGIQQVALDETLPVIFGVLTTETHQQAIDRLDAGARAAEAALEMIVFTAKEI